MKTGNKLGQLRPKGRRQTDKNPTPSAKKCAKELINKAVEHVGISISAPLPVSPTSLYHCHAAVLCLVHSTLTLCKTDELFAAHARTCSLLNARCDASVDVDVAARFSAQAARMRIIKRQRRRRHHHRRRRSCSPSLPLLPRPPPPPPPLHVSALPNVV